jgi:hypothetical protein
MGLLAKAPAARQIKRRESIPEILKLERKFGN